VNFITLTACLDYKQTEPHQQTCLKKSHWVSNRGFSRSKKRLAFHWIKLQSVGHYQNKV